MATALELLRARVTEIKAIPVVVARRVAPKIEARLRSDATTQRGNIPSYGERGDVPIAVEVRHEEIHVNGPDWVLQKAEQKGQVENWHDMIVDEANALANRGIR